MTAPELRVDVVTDAAAFAALADDWDGLVSGCGSATPFQAHSWLAAWLDAYGEAAGLRAITVRAGEDLVAAAAWSLTRRGPFRVLRPVAGNVSDFGDVLVLDALGDRRAEALDALVRGIVGIRGWDVLDLIEVRPGAAVHELADRWRGGRARVPASVCLELPAQDLPDLLSRLSKSTAKHIRGKLRRIDEAGIEVSVVSAEDTPQAVTRFFELHDAQWAGRGITPEHTRPRFRRFLHEALPAMAARDQALLVQYAQGGEVLAMGVAVLDERFLGAYLSGISPGLRQQIDVATLTRRTNMALARERGIPVLNLLRGVEEYKFRWRPDVVENERLVFGRRGSVVAPVYLAAVRARGRLVPWAKEHAPWVRDVRDRVARLLHR